MASSAPRQASSSAAAEALLRDTPLTPLVPTQVNASLLAPSRLNIDSLSPRRAMGAQHSTSSLVNGMVNAGEKSALLPQQDAAALPRMPANFTFSSPDRLQAAFASSRSLTLPANVSGLPVEVMPAQRNGASSKSPLASSLSQAGANASLLAPGRLNVALLSPQRIGSVAGSQPVSTGIQKAGGPEQQQSAAAGASAPRMLATFTLNAPGRLQAAFGPGRQMPPPNANERR